MCRAAGLVAVLAACSAATSERPPRSRAPNVVVVITDDQGYGDLGCHGNPCLDTPNIDALAAASARVEPFYTSPVCTPTRASLLTGRYAYRTRAIDTYVGRAMMDPGEVTLAECLRDAGWATAAFGKWHLGDNHPLRAIDQGFGHAVVHRGGGIGQPSDPPEGAGRYTDPVLFEDGVQVATEGYCTDVYFERALEWIADCRAADRPFFAYIATNAPHGPWHDIPRELYDEYRSRDLSNAAFPAVGRALPSAGADAMDRRARTYAMIANIDANLGRLDARLDELGIGDDTIVVYLHDNGPDAARYNCGLRGTKSDLWDGGIRSPLFVRWRGRVAPGRRDGGWAAHIDVMPTILDLCGVAAPPIRLDGASLARRLLEGRDEPLGRTLFVQSHRGDAPVAEHHFAVRTDRWKLVRASGFGREQPRDGAPFELFDVRADPFEQHDVADRHPDVVSDLRARYRAWFADVGATRPDNYAPPRIVIGTAHEPTTVLTRQDWRVTTPGRGWTAPTMVGAWSVEFATTARHAVRCTLLPIPRAARAVLAIESSRRAVTATCALEAGATTCAFEPIEIDAGPATLSVTVETADAVLGAWQVIVGIDTPR